MNINERFETIIKVLFGGNKRAFANAVGISPTVVENVVGARRGKPSFDVLEKVCANANISAEWLVLGNGDLITDMINIRKDLTLSSTFPVGEGDTNCETVGEREMITTFKTSSTDVLNKPKAIPFAEAARNGLNPIPLVSTKVAAGFGCADFNIEEDDIKDYYVIPKFKNCHVDFMIEITGLSMYPRYNSGDVIACTVLHETKFIQWNKCHVIATREQGMLVKRIMPGEDKEHLRVISDNKDYPPFEIPVDEITGLAVVIGAVCLE